MEWLGKRLGSVVYDDKLLTSLIFYSETRSKMQEKKFIIVIKIIKIS